MNENAKKMEYQECHSKDKQMELLNKIYQIILEFRVVGNEKQLLYLFYFSRFCGILPDVPKTGK